MRGVVLLVLVVLVRIGSAQTVLDSSIPISPDQIPDSIKSVVELYYPNTVFRSATSTLGTFYVDHEIDSLIALWTTVGHDHMYTRQEIVLENLNASIYQQYVQPILDTTNTDKYRKRLFIITDHPGDSYYELSIVAESVDTDKNGDYFTIFTEWVYCFNDYGLIPECPH